MLRLFAYGGTSFNEQRRIGEWPRLPVALCEDSQGLQGGLPSFGFAALPDQRPFLIWRVLQNIENRGGYPFTLLLDPGDEVYEAFEWNTGRLLAALFEEGDRVGHVLLERSPSIRAADVATLIETLPRPASITSPLTADAKVAREFWAAGALTDRLLAISPSKLSLAQRPSAARIGSWQTRLPVGLRNSGGWFVAGDATHAPSIAARLVVVDRMESDVEPPLAAARTLLAAVDTLDRLGKRDPWARSLVARWLDIQAWQRRDGLERACKAMTVLERPESNPDDLVTFADTLTDPPEREAWIAGIRDTLLQDTPRRNPRVTRFLLEQARAGACTLEARHHQRLDPPTRDQFLEELHIPPDRSLENLAIPRDVLVARWETYLRQGGADALARLERAFDELGTVSGTAEKTLIDAAWTAATGAKVPLGSWRAFMNRPHVRQLARDEARQRVHDFPFSPAEYDEFAEDPEWTHLRGSMQRIITPLLQRRSDDDIKRLRSLAQWEERRSLPSADRRQIANLAEGPWAALAALDRLLGGESSVHVPRDGEALPMLGTDIAPAVHALPAGSPPPNLAGLREMVGELPNDALDALAQLHPSMEDLVRAQAWVDAWATLRPEVHRTEDERLTTSKRQKIEGALIGDDALLPPEALRTIFEGDRSWVAHTVASNHTLDRVIRRFASSAPHLAVLLESLDDEQRRAASTLIWHLPAKEVDRALRLDDVRRAVRKIQHADPAAITLARAMLLAPEPPRKKKPWWRK